ncbi:hypothetical protein PPERSA_11077 [Pseudocohnilembus persalinus]|uniref:Uncharacterized protein n=1 Tax=Pseudocohnilembus persalinus TaxID=266149 RepID=A0A0V0R053_PSEPJ|nr:hypothetical protein PPERSA_11077 [Pseudocohnilembus persalinus]|eukprot:KRX07528.1 hypothetical protein PPERSA_11077 [Pseudocohnilembus persalinus]
MGCQVSKQHSVDNSIKQKLGQQGKYNIRLEKYNTVKEQLKYSEKKKYKKNDIINFNQNGQKQKNSYTFTYEENQDSSKKSSKDIIQSNKLQKNEQKSQGSLDIKDRQISNLQVNKTLNNFSHQNYINSSKNLIKQLTFEQNQQNKQTQKIMNQKQSVKYRISVNNDCLIMQQLELQKKGQIKKEKLVQEQQNQYQKEQQQKINQKISQLEYEEINQKVQILIENNKGLQEKQLKKLGEILPKYSTGINFFIQKNLIQKQIGAAVPMLAQDFEDSYIFNKRRIHFKAQIIKNMQKQSIQNDFKNQSQVQGSKVDQIAQFVIRNIRE